MAYTIEALIDKIREFHPELAEKGINLTVNLEGEDKYPGKVGQGRGGIWLFSGKERCGRLYGRQELHQYGSNGDRVRCRVGGSAGQPRKIISIDPEEYFDFENRQAYCQ